MDISEIWRVLAFVIVPPVAIWGIYRACCRIKTPALRSAGRVISFLLAILSTLLACLLLFGEWACTARVPAKASPDGKHIALESWGLQGATGADLATVQVRSRWSPVAKLVYSGPGSSVREVDPEVRWIDNTHLLIRYNKWDGYEHTCKTSVESIDIVCEVVPLNQ